jgi:hypothetical protein
MQTDNETFRKTLLCFESAIRELALGRGNLRSRLIAASKKFLYMVKREDLPIDELKDDYDWIVKQLTIKEPMRDSLGNVIWGQVQVSLYRRRSSTLQQIVERIFYIRDRMSYFQIEELKEEIDKTKLRKK